MSFFIRSRDGKRLVNAQSAELDGMKILVNGAEFGTYGSEEDAMEAFTEMCRECADLETFYDLSGEIESEDDDWDEDDEDDEEDDGDGGFRVLFR